MDLTPWKRLPKTLERLKILLAERNSRVKLKRQLLCQQHDYKRMTHLGIQDGLTKKSQALLDVISDQIHDLETEIEQLIVSDNTLKKQADLIRSVPGVGKVVSWYFIAKTGGFRLITQPRKMACYCGVVPFEYQSGTSIYRKPGVSMYADKMMKSLLHLSAMTSVQRDNDLKSYYQRKIKEGKSKMSVLNAVRNKIIHRVFAVIKHQKFYQNPLALS